MLDQKHVGGLTLAALTYLALGHGSSGETHSVWKHCQQSQRLIAIDVLLVLKLLPSIHPGIR